MSVIMATKFHFFKNIMILPLQ